MRERDERQNRADPEFWRAMPYIKNVSEAVSRLLAPLGVGVAHRPEATMRRQVMRPKDPLPWHETSGVVYRIWCSCGQSNYVGETGRLLRKRIAEHAAAVRRNDASSQVAAHSRRPSHTFKLDEAEILARRDNRVSRELLESLFTGPQSINKWNDMPTPYSVLREQIVRELARSSDVYAKADKIVLLGDFPVEKEGEVRHNGDTPKNSLKRLQTNSVNLDYLNLKQPACQRTVKSGAGIYETNCITAAIAKCEVNNAQPSLTCP
nr:unnamed protein product [Spirometra erinaceieuropaei]